MAPKAHALNSICDPDCPIAELHRETVSILQRYPVLDLAPKAHPIYLYRDGEESFHFGLSSIPLKTVGGSEWIEVPKIPRASFHEALEFFDHIRLIGNPRIIFEQGDEFTEFTPLYNPGGLNQLPWSETQAILDWHRHVLNRSSMETPWAPSSVPVLPINILWLLDIAHSWFIQSPKRRSRNRIGPISVLPMTHFLTHSKGISPTISAHLCYNRNKYVRQVAAYSPNCPEEAQVAAALLGFPPELTSRSNWG